MPVEIIKSGEKFAHTYPDLATTTDATVTTIVTIPVSAKTIDWNAETTLKYT